MTILDNDNRILYTYIIRILYKKSRFSFNSNTPNRYLTAEEILKTLKEMANATSSLEALQDYLDKHPTLSPDDLDTFLYSVQELEYPKQVNQKYFHCNPKNSEGKTIRLQKMEDGRIGYAIPKKSCNERSLQQSNDFLVLVGMMLTPTENQKFKISDLEKTIQNLAGEQTIGRQAITEIAKKLCEDKNIEKLGFHISYETTLEKRRALIFSIQKIFSPTEASMLADMLRTYPYYSNTFANGLIEKLQFFDENGTYSFPDENQKPKGSNTTNIHAVVDGVHTRKGSFRLEEKECEQFLDHIRQLKQIIRNKHKAYMTYGQRVVNPEETQGQILTLREKTVVNPHEVVWANGYYYFVATPENEEHKCEKHAHNYRIDRIMKLEELEETAKTIVDAEGDFSDTKGDCFSPVAYRGTHNMMMRGDIYNITLKCKKPLLSHVLDCFGTNTTIKKLHGKDEDWFEASFRSTLGGVAYGVTQYMDECIVIDPPELREMVFKNVARGLENYKEAGFLPPHLEKYL